VLAVLLGSTMRAAMESPFIKWPAEFKPENTKVYVSNRIAISADPATVWAWLIFADSWPKWYANSSQVVLDGATDGQLSIGTKFHWKTFGVNLDSNVKEFEPFQRLAWDATANGIQAYHAWLIVPTPKGCTVLTEETQNGLLARLGKFFRSGQMHSEHQKWLEGLKTQAESGMPIQ